MISKLVLFSYLELFYTNVICPFKQIIAQDNTKALSIPLPIFFGLFLSNDHQANESLRDSSIHCSIPVKGNYYVKIAEGYQSKVIRMVQSLF